MEAGIPRSYLFIYGSDVPRETYGLLLLLLLLFGVVCSLLCSLRCITHCYCRADKRLSEIRSTCQASTSFLLKAEALSEGAAPNSNIADSSVNMILTNMMTKSIAPFLEKHMAELNEIVRIHRLLERLLTKFSTDNYK